MKLYELAQKNRSGILEFEEIGYGINLTILVDADNIEFDKSEPMHIFVKEAMVTCNTTGDMVSISQNREVFTRNIFNPRFWRAD